MEHDTTLYAVAGLKRGGIHAVVDWLRAGLTAPTMVLNNVRHGKLKDRSGNMRFAENYTTAPEARDNVVMVFEDFDMAAVASSPLLGPFVRRKFLLVLRDPFNVTASRMKRIQDGTSPGELNPLRGIERWKQYARRHAATGAKRVDPWLPLNFNRWVTDASYRGDLATACGLDEVPPYPQRVARTGNGSSFDGYEYDGLASEMPIFDRWRQFDGNPKFRRLCYRDDVFDLCERVFGFRRPHECASTYSR